MSPRRAHLPALAPLLAALTMGDPGCHDEPGPAASSLAVAAPTVSVSPDAPAPTTTSLALPAGAPVAYQLAWDWGAASLDASGARSLTTALGYRVTVEKLYTATVSMELIPCTTARRERPRPPLGWLSPRSAAADHDYNHDASLLSVAVPETAAGEPQGFGKATASGQTYCQLFALGGAVADWTSDGFRMQGWSLYFRGSYARDDESPRSVEAFVGLGRGALRPLTAAAPVLADADGVQVTLTRHVAQALDDVDFAALSPTDLAFEILARLGTTATASVE
jgi:hypothetical protein